MPPFDPKAAVTRFAQIVKSYRLAGVTGDAYAAAWVETAFAEAGISYVRAELDKSATYLAAFPAFAQHRAELLDHPRLINELRLLERRPRMGGRGDAIDHPPRQSDDAANAALGALWECAKVRHVTGQVFAAYSTLLDGLASIT